MLKFIHLILLLILMTYGAAYEVPHAEFKIFRPKGFEVSIPAEENITLFAFHGNLNKQMDGLETGKWARDIVTPKNGRFVFRERETSLKLGDIIYFWTYVVYNCLGYREEDVIYVVTQYTPEEEAPVARTPSSGVSSKPKQSVTTFNKGLPTLRCHPDYEVPHAAFKIFSPKGFEVSIPAEENVTFYAFHGKLNEEMNGLEAGKWAKDIAKPKDGRFTFRDNETSLKLGDVIYYWTYAVYNRLGYREDDGVYVVMEYTPQEGVSAGTVLSSVTGGRAPTSSTKQPVTTAPSEGIFTEGVSTEGISTDCQPSITTTNNGLPIRCVGEIIFEEHFNDNKLDPSKWLMERRFASQPDYEFVVYLLNDQVLKIRNGIATIKPIPLTRIYGNGVLKEELSLGSNCTGVLDTEDCVRPADSDDILPPFISSQFSTKDRFSFKYGKVEIRAKMPNALWVFPQLFLEPVNLQYGSRNYQSGQMRVAFSRSRSGDLVDELFGGVILNAQEPYRNARMCEKTGPPVDWSLDFHLYTLEWLSDKIVVSVDNEQYCVMKPNAGRFANMVVNGKSLPNKEHLKTGLAMAPFDQEFYIKLGYGIGGRNDFPDDKKLWLHKKPWTNSNRKSMKQLWNKQKKNWNQWMGASAALQIDYVKVYAV